MTALAELEFESGTNESACAILEELVSESRAAVTVRLGTKPTLTWQIRRDALASMIEASSDDPSVTETLYLRLIEEVPGFRAKGNAHRAVAKFYEKRLLDTAAEEHFRSAADAYARVGALVDQAQVCMDWSAVLIKLHKFDTAASVAADSHKLHMLCGDESEAARAHRAQHDAQTLAGVHQTACLAYGDFLTAKFSPDLHLVHSAAAALAAEHGHESFFERHVLTALVDLLRKNGPDLLHRSGGDSEQLTDRLRTVASDTVGEPVAAIATASGSYAWLVRRALVDAYRLGSSHLGIEHVLLAVLSYHLKLHTIGKEYGVDISRLREEVKRVKSVPPIPQVRDVK
ncbi:hypothetical protein [Rhodococcoides corynebacterioides]|uniref:hypothetical protein n=1 Tax=Rhodococcoides corynebacterioides TaxID=53972 RepID=UPI003AE913BF